ncbi:MAG: PIN domain-containing protein [Terriglobia bacterium]|jgi:predicted nucleic acid-binding protein
METDPLFFDTGAIDFLYDPALVGFWKRFGSEPKYFTSPVVYWEYVRQFDPGKYAPPRALFQKLLEKGTFEFLHFGREEADVAHELYIGLRKSLGSGPQAKIKMKDLHCDMIIAATALRRQIRVLTGDIKDWSLILTVAQSRDVGSLKVLDKKDIQPGL